jgi:phage-related protein
MATPFQPKPLLWIASTRDDLREFPSEVRQIIGYGLYLAQTGDKHLDAKPLKGFGGAGTLEIVADHDGDTYRAVYTVRFADAVYALHAFQKKSKRGIATPKREIERIRGRLRQAQEHYETWRRHQIREVKRHE